MKKVCLLLLTFGFTAGSAYAGGPLAVGSPSFGVDGQPMTWPNGVVTYRIDGGFFAGSRLSNSIGVSRVAAMFSTWSSVPTASLTITNQGALLPVAGFSDGDVSTVAEYNAVEGDCSAGHQSAIIFDANGSIFNSLIGDPGVVGFASPCAADGSGRVQTGLAMLNGAFLDGISNSSNYEISDDLFDQAITHELGHLLGLDHSQINVELKNKFSNCDATSLAGLPIMFPFLSCQTRVSAGLPKLAADDIAWISKLYPSASFNSQFGVISGRIYFSDGITAAQGVNVVARDLNDPKKAAVSAVSGLLFTGNVGQSVTGDNTGGSEFGSRSPSLEGYFEIPVLAGSYTLEVESIDPEFTDGSRVGPLLQPIPIPGNHEFWNDVESAGDDPLASTPIVVGPGAIVNGKDIHLNGTLPRFDDYEDE